jgi:hypothetical protein
MDNLARKLGQMNGDHPMRLYDQFKYKEGDVVTCNLSGGFVGTVRGVSYTAPYVEMYIVELTHHGSELLKMYPYSCIVVPGSELYLVDKPADWDRP